MRRRTACSCRALCSRWSSLTCVECVSESASKGGLRLFCLSQICLVLRRGKAQSERHILRNVSGAVHPGQMLAIMGATGSGKSSAMNILARRLILSGNLHVSGTVLLNGAPRGRRWKSSYLEQTDCLLATLTVEETLQFSARLRMSPKCTPEERQMRVYSVIRTLGLGAVAHTRVGGDLSRGISGGEQKRLALGVEMVVNPPLLFLDEPTSGLDAFNAQSLMATLKVLTTTGRSIVVCIHQPRSAITSMFSALLLLSEGRMMWSGLAGDEPLQFFETLGFRMPPHTNPSDFYLDVVSVASHTTDTERVTRKRIDMIAEAYAQEQPVALQRLRESADELAKDMHVRATSVAEGGVAVPMAPPQADVGNHGAPGLPQRPWLVELWALLYRATRLVTRQKLENTVNVLRTTIFALLLGLIWLNVGKNAARGGDPGEIRNTGGLLFFTIVNHSFSGVFGVVFTFASESRLVLRERIAGAYRVSSYFIAYLAVELPRVAVWSLLHSAVIYWIVGLRPSASALLIFYAIHILVQLNAEAITLIFTAATRSEKMAAALAPIPLVISILFGGFFVQPASIPIWLRWIRYVTYMRWSYVALVRNEYSGRTFARCAQRGDGGPFDQCFRHGQQAVDLLVPDSALGVTACAWVLVGLIAAYWVGTYAVLRVNKPHYDTAV